MTKLNLDNSFGVRVPDTYSEYKALLDLLTDNGVQVTDELFYNPGYYPDSAQSAEWYIATSGAYNAQCWHYLGVVRHGDELVTYVSDSIERYQICYDSVDDMLQALTEKSDEGVVLSDRIKGFDGFEVTLRCGSRTVKFGDCSQIAIGNKAHDPLPELSCLRTLEQVNEALKDDSVTILWSTADGSLIRPHHLSWEIKLAQAANMMQEGIYVAAKK